jgi:hypothetical protein
MLQWQKQFFHENKENKRKRVISNRTRRETDGEKRHNFRAFGFAFTIALTAA